LTKCYNKKYFIDTLNTEVSYSRRHKTSLSLIIFDLDHFKQVNDTYGHVAGDHVLIDVSGLVHHMLRAEDVFARYGGEEFVIILRGIGLADAGILAERVRAAVQRHQFIFGEQRLPVTVSVGVAEYDPITEDPLALVEAADGALYAAKKAGRNRVLLKYGDQNTAPTNA